MDELKPYTVSADASSEAFATLEAAMMQAARLLVAGRQHIVVMHPNTSAVIVMVQK